MTTVMNEALKTTLLLSLDDSRFKQLPQTDDEVIKELIT